MRHIRKIFLFVLAALATACSREAPQGLADDIAEARSEADEATAISFAGGELPACSLLSRAEVETVLGPLAVDPYARDERGPARGGSHCGYQAVDGRLLVVDGSTGDASDRLAEIDAAGPVPVDGNWEEAGLVGCCVLHAVRDDALVTVDASGAKLDLARVAALTSLALGRVRDPLRGVDPDAAVEAALRLEGGNAGQGVP